MCSFFLPFSPLWIFFIHAESKKMFKISKKSNLWTVHPRSVFIPIGFFWNTVPLNYLGIVESKNFSLRILRSFSGCVDKIKLIWRIGQIFWAVWRSQNMTEYAERIYAYTWIGPKDSRHKTENISVNNGFFLTFLSKQDWLD